ncbi:calmodulin-alpha-like isoform X1 [Mya arenaria]|uniref:calmodulin-alpha-like isoform X1 n=1 Tax=Mya arenaria TaxID=6604 RepID=UPI0022E5AA77|nr:calmodulin-alpha-like isoform X1 [Mya arenaria]
MSTSRKTRRKNGVDRLTDKDVKEYRRVFDEYKGRTGEVEYRHLEKMLNKLSQQPDELEMESIYEHLDIYCNGSISFPHFLTLMANRFSVEVLDTKARKKRQEADDLLSEMKEAFKVFDGDGNGYISQAELKHTLYKMGERLMEEEIEEMMMEADTDGDGQISFPEFCRLVRIQEMEDNPGSQMSQNINATPSQIASALSGIQEVDD